MTDLVERINALLKGPTGPAHEREILNLLTAASADDLNAALHSIDVARLFNDMDDRLIGPDNHRALANLLFVERLPELDLDSRANLIYGLQTGQAPAFLTGAVGQIFLEAHGKELRNLRNKVDDGGDHHDLQKLIFEDLDDDGVRQDILDHIAAEAARNPIDHVKILSDIDDTVFARIHDHRYPGKVHYPGVLEFFRVLDEGIGDPDTGDGDITFVTARPGLIHGVVENYTLRRLREAGIKNPVVLTGRLFAIRSRRTMAAKKVVNITRHRQLYPEYGLVFVGDSGQGDVDTARQLWRDMPEAMRGVFIHDVKETSLAERSLKSSEGIDFFDTYVSGAAAAWKRGLISVDQVESVAEVAMREIEDMGFLPAPMRESRIKEHHDDLAAFRDLVRDDDEATA